MTTREEIEKAARNAHSALCVTYHHACDGSGDAHFAVTRLGDLAMGLAAEVERIRRVLLTDAEIRDLWATHGPGSYYGGLSPEDYQTLIVHFARSLLRRGGIPCMASDDDPRGGA